MILDLYSRLPKPRTLTRQELYDLVWSKPMRDLAKDFDLSDQGLAKKCKRHNIPRPPQGYWLKKEQARKRLVKPLPPNNDPVLETIYFSPKPEPVKPIPEPKSVLNEEELAAALEFRIPASVNRYHPLIAKCRMETKKPGLDNYGRIAFGHRVTNPGFKVTPKTFDRACLFLQGIITLVASFGWKLKENKDRVLFSYQGNDIAFEIKERVRQVENKDSGARLGLDRVPYPRYLYHATGELEFIIDEPHLSGFTKRWNDRGNQKIEDQLASIVQGCSRAFDAERLWKIQWEEQRQKWAIEDAERKEQERLQKIEENRRKQLFSLAEQYHKAKSVRDFLGALDKSQENPEGMTEWLSWANAVIDEIDPLCRKEKIIEKHHELAEPPKSYWP